MNRILVFSSHDKHEATLSATFLMESDALEHASRFRSQDVRIRDCGEMNRFLFAELMRQAIEEVSHRWHWTNLPGKPLAAAQTAEIAEGAPV